MSKSSPIRTNADWRARWANIGSRGYKAYKHAVETGAKNRVAALLLAARALDEGERAYGLGRPWPTLAARLRRMAQDTEDGLVMNAEARAAAQPETLTEASPLAQPAGTAPAAA